MTTKRSVDKNPVYQGVDEQIAYIFEWSAIGTPSNPTVVIKDSTGTDVSSTKLSGSASVASTQVTTPKVVSLTSGEKYRLECKVTISNNILEAFVEIYGED